MGTPNIQSLDPEVINTTSVRIFLPELVTWPTKLTGRESGKCKGAYEYSHSHTPLRVCTTFKYSLRYLKCNLWDPWETCIAYLGP